MRATHRVSRREVAFRKALWRAGVRGYRVDVRLPGRPDLYFPAIKLAVFIHGCFWHRCPTCALKPPAANGEFWRQKFAANAARDGVVVERLKSEGVAIEVVWEHDIRSDISGSVGRIARAVAGRRGMQQRSKPVDA